MDVGAFVQENKRWLVGVAVGALVWLIGSVVVDSMYDVSGAFVSPRKLGAPATAYTSGALSAAQEESDALAAERKRLETELSFVQSDRFTKWSGDADTYLYVTGRDIKRELGKSGNERDVLVRTRTSAGTSRPASTRSARCCSASS